MSRYSKIYRKMWMDDRFRALSAPQPNGQTLWQYLLTNPYCTSIPGLFSAGEAMLAEALDWPLKDFREVFQEVSTQGMAQADWKARVIFLPNAIKYNLPESPNVIKGWLLSWEDIPECPLKNEAWQVLKDSIEGMPTGFQKVFREVFPEPCRKTSRKTMPNQEQEQEQEEEDVQISENKESVSEQPLTAPPPSLSIKQLVAAYNTAKPDECPVVDRITTERKAKYSRYLKQFPSLAYWEVVFDELNQSSFLRGLKNSGDHPPQARGLDWLCQKGKNDAVENCQKTYEGKYRDKQPVHAPTRASEWYEDDQNNPLSHDPS